MHPFIIYLAALGGQQQSLGIELEITWPGKSKTFTTMFFSNHLLAYDVRHIASADMLMHK